MIIAPSVYKRIVAGKLYMDQNFQESINLNSVSRKACISRFHFHRLFTRIYNKTPHQYLRKKRITLACELLAEDRLTISEICNWVGFESMSTFSTMFKKENGIGPRDYRNMMWLKKEKTRQFPVRFIPHCFIDTFKIQ